MKNVILCLISISFLFFCCKKEQNRVKSHSSTETKYAVKFNLSQFKQTVENFKATSSLSAEEANFSLKGSTLYSLSYMIYDNKGNEIHRFEQDTTTGSLTHMVDFTKPSEIPEEEGEYTQRSTLQPFGQITDSLAKGDYTIVVIGTAARRIGINWSRNQFEDIITRNLSTASFAYPYGLDSYPRAVDTFFKKLKFTVGADPLEQQVVLDRIVGRISIVIEDAIPQEASYFQVYYENEKFGLQFDSETLIGGTAEDPSSYKYKYLTEADKGKTNFNVNNFTFINTVTPIEVHIECLDAEDNIIASVVANAQIYKNKVTVLKGKLFNNLNNRANFQVGLNDKWDCDSAVVNF